MRGETTIAELCRRESINANLYYKWSKDFMEAGKSRLDGDIRREATPGVIKSGSKSDEMVQNLDFAQTFLEAAGITPPEDMQGESLIPLLKGDTKSWDREAVY